MLTILAVLKAFGFILLACLCATIIISIIPWVMFGVILFFRGCRWVIVFSWELVMDISSDMLNK